jgi:hypothetical protein
MSTLPVPRLAALLRHNARGWYPTEAATELLIAHERWLHHSDFLLSCVWASPNGGVVDGPPVWFDEFDPPRWFEDFYTDTAVDDRPVGTSPDQITSAGISWDDVPQFLDRVGCSGSEARILRIAAELAGIDTGQPLAELLSSLDGTNSSLVIQAVAHALHHPLPTTCTVSSSSWETDR